MNFIPITDSSEITPRQTSAVDSAHLSSNHLAAERLDPEATNPVKNPQHTSSGERFRQLLTDIWQQRSTGRLTIVCPPHRWYLFFDAGHCLYATGTHHRMRRWNRALQLGAPGLDVQNLTFELNQPWEYHLLAAAIEDSRLTVEQGIAVSLVSLREIIFAIISSVDLTWHWQTTPAIAEAESLQFWINPIKIDMIFLEAMRLYKQWMSLGLDFDYMNGAPLITKQPSAHGQYNGQYTSAFGSVRALLNGKHTFWDLALISPAPLAITTRILRYFLQQGCLTFRDLPDLPIPSYFLDRSSTSPATAHAYAPLIACIDDSVELCHQVQQVVTDAGYRCLTISDPLQAVSQLMEHQPQFILLDLVMPVIGGYELCKQLRRAKIFETTPIVVLTSRPDTIARLRSTLIGATDFLGKPLDPKVLLNFLDRHFDHDINDRALTALDPNLVNSTTEHKQARTHVA